MKSRRHVFRADDGRWLPEHIRFAIAAALSRDSADGRRRRVFDQIRRDVPSLPMNDRELAGAIDRIAASKV